MFDVRKFECVQRVTDSPTILRIPRFSIPSPVRAVHLGYGCSVSGERGISSRYGPKKERKKDGKTRRERKSWSTTKRWRVRTTDRIDELVFVSAPLPLVPCSV